ncbi:MAG: dihydroorotate dehydrogenase electron transfer subunit [Phycisphaerae bacterium]|nr:dihydroorotate dehydrogenase electron transfer subunit [Phycisphaerae bacterium]
MSSLPSKKGIFTASVLQNRGLGDKFFRLSLEIEKKANSFFSAASAGQFVEIDVSQLAAPSEKLIPQNLEDSSQRNILLRRPFSFADIDSSNDCTIVEILYCVLGPATLRMKTLKTSDTVNLIGPLGNGFTVPKDKKSAILVAGGMGAPPLIHLAKVLRKQHQDITITAFVGAKTKDDLAFFDIKTDKLKKPTDITLQEFAKHNIKPFISTDDGSAGSKGFVTEILKNHIAKHKPAGGETIIYACGPEAMLSATAALSSEFKIPCQVSLERRMACGIGLCQSCAVKCKAQNGTAIYKLCCKDGPVFWTDEVVWE